MVKMVKCHRHGGRARPFTESMHTRIGTYSQKSTRDAKLREQSGIFASKAPGGGSLRKRNISSLKCCVERQ